MLREKLPAITSNFAILDVEKHRLTLERHIKKNGPVRLTVELEVTGPFGSNDGTSMEFNCNVLSIAQSLKGNPQ